MGIRLSPHEGVGPNDVRDSNPELPFSHVLQGLGQRYSQRLAYVHLIETTRSWRVDHADYEASSDVRKQVAPLPGLPTHNATPDTHKANTTRTRISVTPTIQPHQNTANAFSQCHNPVSDDR